MKFEISAKGVEREVAGGTGCVPPALSVSNQLETKRNTTKENQTMKTRTNKVHKPKLKGNL